MNPIISVIVPIYNAQDYLHRCLDSILNQRFKDFELLLVNDGSLDKSGAICDVYVKKDRRVKSFHKDNGGVSSARQYGLDNAIGEYIIHVDPDDWVEVDYLEKLYYKAKEDYADIVICDFYFDYKDTRTWVHQSIASNITSNELLRKLLLQQVHGACWNKLIRRAIYIQNDIKFPENVIRWEDLWVNCEILLNDLKISYVPYPLYHYDQVINNLSIVRVPTFKGVQSQILFCKHFESILLATNEDFKDELYTIKESTKNLMYESGLYTFYELKNMFNEINEIYISKHGKVSIRRYKYFAFSQLLKGNYKSSKFINTVFSIIYAMLVCCKQIIIKIIHN